MIGRAEQAQPSGYVPPVVGAPTWPRVEPNCFAADHVGRLADLTNRYRGHSVALNRIGWVLAVALGDVPGDAEKIFGDPLDEARRAAAAIVERDRLRGVIAAAYVDLLAGRVDDAIGALRAAGGQP